LLDDLVREVQRLKAEGKTVVQSHGIFDLIHPGIIRHLDEAKGQGDVLVVTVVKDRDVRRGSGRPLFQEVLRAENVASLEQVDYVCLVDDETPFQCVKMIKPQIFAKGRAYLERDQQIHARIFGEERESRFGDSIIYETTGFSFSTSNIIGNYLELYPDDTKAFLKRFSEKYPFGEIVQSLNSLRDLKVLLIGDGIIDEYDYCLPMGRSAKSPIVVNKYVSRDVFAGAVFIIANHLAGLCNEVKLVTLLGREDTREEFIRRNLKSNVSPEFFYRDDAPTIVKRRFIHEYSNQKLFEVNYINDSYIDKTCESGIIEYLARIVPAYDIVLVSDFGHGFITGDIIRTIKDFSRTYAVNTQTNAANTGYNLITKYENPDFVCLDETEARLATQDKFADIEKVASSIARKLQTNYLIITLGRNGSIGVTKDREINRTPIFSTKVVDTVGAGDAFFAFTAPCFAMRMPLDLVSFIGNAVGALAVQIVGNKKPVEKFELLEFIHAILR
jgi:bifunctional ADP-heptose synthase (sugar kinase/adenylyltransferase)